MAWKKILWNDDVVIVRKNSGANIGTRQRLNFIEGSNITLAISDDAVGDEIDISIATVGFDSLADGTTYKKFLATERTKLAGIDTGADVTADHPPQAHGASVHTDRIRKFTTTPHHTTGSMSARGVLLDGAGVSEYAYFLLKLPEDFISIAGLDVIIERTAGLTGGVVLDVTLYAAASGEFYNNHTNTDLDNVITISDGTVIVTALDHTTLFSNVTKNDYIYVTIMRESGHVSDTYGADIYLRGVEIEYTADM